MPDDPTPDPAPTPEPKPAEPTPQPIPEPTQAPDPRPEPSPEPGPEGPTLDGKPFDPQRAMDTILRQREREKELEAQLRELKPKAAKLDEIERAQLSEQEQAELRAREAEDKATKAERTLRKANLISALNHPDLNLVDARAAAKLIEGVEYDDDGEPSNLGRLDEADSLIAKFLAEHPYLRGERAKPTPPPTDAREGGDRRTPQLSAEEIAAAERAGMSHEEYAAYKGGATLADLEAAGLTKPGT